MNKKQFLWVGLVLMFGLVLPLSAAGQDILYTPRLILSAEYNDNILFLRNDKIDDFLLNVTPALSVDYKTELLDLSSAGGVTFKRYFTETEYDRENYYFDLDGKYRLTERFFLNGRFNYIQDTTLESIPVDSNAAGSDPVENIGDQGIERFYSQQKLYKARAGMQYQLTELSDLGMSYRYLKSNYDFEGNVDYTRNTLDFTYSRLLRSQKDKIGPRLSYIRGTSDVSDYNSYDFAFAWLHIFTETTSLYTDLGVRYTDETLNYNDESKGDWRGTADILLRRRGESNVIDIGFYQNVVTGSLGTPENVSKLYLKLKQFLSERTFIEVKGDLYATDEGSFLNFNNTTIYFDIIPSLVYRITENHSVRLAYSYTIDYDDSLESNQDKQRNRVWILFDFGFPNLWKH